MKSRALIVVLLSLTLLCLGATTLVNLAFQVTGILPAANFTVATTCPTCVVASSPGVGIAHFAGSTQTVTSSAVNLAGADVTGIAPPANGGTATVTSSGLGFAFMPYNPVLAMNANGGAAGQVVSNANDVFVTQFVLPYQITVTKVTIRLLATGGAGKKVSVGIYNSAKNLVLDSGTFDATSVAGVQTNTIGSVTLLPGIYWAAQTSDSNTTTSYSWVSVSTASVTQFMNNGSKTGYAVAGNTSTAGALPSALGTLTANAQRNPIVFYIEP